MPTLKIQTNVATLPTERSAILQDASARVAEVLGKPERYVMVLLETNPDMLFAGTDEPLAYLELKSLGLPEDKTPVLSSALCEFMEAHFKVPAERTYIEFTSPPRHMFGWSGRTFSR
jgi:phenylpyruvate tautomerase PptA (4-oxalocrotonate tautomerase family)